MKLEDLIARDQVVDLGTLKADEELVEQIQTRLSDLGLYPSSLIDKLYGQRTEDALIQFCDAVNLNNMRTSRFGKNFAEKLLNLKELPYEKFLSDTDYRRAADLLGVEQAVIRAVVDVETSGSGFLPDGRPKILFERHWFWSLTPLPVSKTRPDLSDPQPGGYLGGDREWHRLNDAIKFDRVAALKSASWGLGQVMGFNYAIAGYRDIEEFVRAMHHSEGKQLEAMMNFIQNKNLVSALRRRDWTAFAFHYNGEAGVGVYDVKLARVYDFYTSAIAA